MCNLIDEMHDGAPDSSLFSCNLLFDDFCKSKQQFLKIT